MMNRYGARGSPLRTPVLTLKFVVSPSGVSTTVKVFHTSFVWIWRSPLGCQTHRESRTVCFYLRVKGFLEVNENNGNLFLVVSHFLDDASKSKNL